MIAFWLLSTLGSKATHVVFHIRFILDFGAAYALVFEALTFEFHRQHAKPLHTYKLRTVCLVRAHYAINGFSLFMRCANMLQFLTFRFDCNLESLTQL